MKHQSKENLRKIVERKKIIRLDLGCGPHKQEGGFLGIDARRLPGVDIVHDLESFPWPLPSSCAQVVVISHFWEHIKPWLTLKFMKELHRVCTDNAMVFISGPYSVEARYVQDPTHCNPSNEATFCYWDNNHPLWEVYKPPVFRLLDFRLIPVGLSRDFNAVLKACKSPKTIKPQSDPSITPIKAIVRKRTKKHRKSKT